MEDYPQEYVALTRPLVVLLGLQDEQANSDLPKPLNNGAAITSNLPSISQDRHKHVLSAIRKYGDSPLVAEAGVHSHAAPINQALRFHLKASSRRYVFPSRKASPPPSQVSPIGSSGASSASSVLHSPLSPLSLGSPCHPNAVMTPLWFKKYQEALPAVFVSFFEINHDINNDTLNDNRLKNDISTFQSALESINVKSKLIAVLLGDDSTAGDSSLEARMSNIRKGAKLENKATFFFLPWGASAEQTEALFDTVFHACRSFCVDFYKSLHKHARRKKDRRSSSLPTTPSLEQAPQHLLHAGWNARYAVKMALFSEIRYEMDAAARSYDEALDVLMEPGGTFDQTSSWSPRFNEARLLADCVALRRVRALLADGHSANAAWFWVAYRDRVLDMVERLGKGSASYGWPCWQARWARIMGQLVGSAPSLASDSNARRSLEPIEGRRRSAYAMATKLATQPLDQVNPFMRHLHHPGYWLSIAAEYTQIRATLSREIPEEDRNPPGQSPAASVARVHREYESYLCPEPHVEATQVDHTQLIVRDLEGAVNAYEQRGHVKAATIARFHLAKALERKTADVAANAYQALLDTPGALAQEWTAFSKEATARLFSASEAAGKYDVQVETMSHMLHKGFRYAASDIPDLSLLLHRANESYEALGLKHTVDIDLNGSTSFINLATCFQAQEVSAGEKIILELVARSSAVPESKLVHFSRMQADVEGLGQVVLRHEDGGESTAGSELREVVLEENEAGQEFSGSADLTLHPGQARVFNLSLPMRDVGNAYVKKLLIAINMPWLEVNYAKQINHKTEPFRWFSWRNGVGLVKQRQRWGAGQVTVLPKQPRMKLQMPGLKSSYYTNEQAAVEVDVINEESDDVDVELEAWLVGAPSEEHALSFPDPAHDSRAASRDGAVCVHVGNLSSRDTRTMQLKLHFPSLLHGEVSLELEARYHAVDDRQRRASKITSTKINLIEPFQTSFILEPVLHPDQWPSYFDAGSSELKTMWQLQLNLTSQAEEDVILESSEMQLSHVDDEAVCNVDNPQNQKLVLAGAGMFQPVFTLRITKKELDDSRPAIVEANVAIVWHRAGSTDRIRTLIPTPRLNLPTSEPRALATRQPPREDGSFTLMITLENPSMHYLSFELIVDPTDDFVLSGPTRRSLNLVPLSRHAVSINILPLVDRGNYVRPSVKVIDTYFNKLLRVHPGEGLSIDESGSLLIWLDDG